MSTPTSPAPPVPTVRLVTEPDPHEVPAPPARPFQCRSHGMGGAVGEQAQAIPVCGPHAAGELPETELASGGRRRFAVLDGITAPDGKPWPVTTVEPGGWLRVRWWLPEARPTAGFSYWITRRGWDATAPLGRHQFDEQPVASVHAGPQPRPLLRAADHLVRLPADRAGRHVLHCVWTEESGTRGYSQTIDLDLPTSPDQPDEETTP